MSQLKFSAISFESISDDDQHDDDDEEKSSSQT